MIETGILSLILFASILTVLVNRSLLDALIEALHNFRGGPPTAMHPSPANDSALIRRRCRPTKNSQEYLRS